MRYRFGEHELDLEAYELRRAGTPLKVWPKVFDVLRYLVENAGRTVTKQELLDALWSDSVVDEVAVPWTISHARRALGQRGGDKAPIETVHGRGYRFTAPVEAIETPPPKASVPPPAVLPAPDTSDALFVGREDAMRQLDSSLAELLRGRGGMCALVGAAGIGKTRCMDELALRARRAGVDTWLGRSVEDGWAPVYWPWVQIVRQLAADRPALQERAHALLDRLGALARGADESAESADSFWWIDGVSRLVVEAARARPVLLLFDDVHWADTASIELLAFLVPELHRVPVLVVCTQRPVREGAQARALAKLSRHAQSLELAPLTLDDVARYVRSATGVQALDAELVQALHLASAGNPLFLQQTVRTLQARHGQSAVASLSPAQVGPSTVARDVLGAALRSLPPAMVEVLTVASVLGERFDLATLRSLAEHEVDELLACLDGACAEALLVAEEPVAYRFCHALLRTVAYEALPAERRVRLHRRAAEIMEQAPNARLGEIAHHRHASLPLGDCARATDAAMRAARMAARMQAFVDASEYCAWALAAQALEPEPSARDRAELLAFAAQMKLNAGDEDAARRMVEELVRLARPEGHYDVIVRAIRVVRHTHMMGAMEDPMLRAWLEEALDHAPAGPNELRIHALSQLSWTPPYAHDMERSKQLSAEALSLARLRGDERVLMRALNARLHSLSGPDDVDALKLVADELLDRNRNQSGWVTAAAYGARYAAALHVGDRRNADRALDDLLAAAQAGQWGAVIWYQQRLALQTKLMRGELDTVERELPELRERGRRYRVSYAGYLVDLLSAVLNVERLGMVVAKGMDLSFLQAQMSTSPIGARAVFARVFASAGDVGQARALLEALSAQDFGALPKDGSYLHALASLGLVSIALQDRLRAQAIYVRLLPYARFMTPTIIQMCEGGVAHFLGVLAAYLGHDGAVAEHYELALQQSEAMGMRPQLARTCHAYASWLAKRSKPERARADELRARALDIARDQGMHGMLRVLQAAGD